MRMRIRFLWIWLQVRFRSKSTPIPKQSVLSFRVMPWDCVHRCMGNDRYHRFMDLGRIDLALRFGWRAYSIKCRPLVVVGCYTNYEQPLQVFDRFVLRTHVVHIKGVYVWMAQQFEKNGTIYYSALSKAIVLIGSKGVSPKPQYFFDKRTQERSFWLLTEQLFDHGDAHLRRSVSDPLNPHQLL